MGISFRDKRDERFWKFVFAVMRPALLVAPNSFLKDVRTDAVASGIPAAVAAHETGPIFEFLVNFIQYQGISNAAAYSFAEKHGNVRWAQIQSALLQKPACGLLRSYWDFAGCRYIKRSQTCAHPEHMPSCPLPKHPLRKGGLNQAAYSLFLFIRDFCAGDLVGWIDDQLAAADSLSRGPERLAHMRAALLGPLSNVYGISEKVLSMALANFLLGSDPNRKQWVETGASMIVIDTLMHNFLHRTGVLRRAHAEHSYGAPCYAAGGCVDIIDGLTQRIDAREFNPDFPAYFPRFVQHAIWRFCAQEAADVCNGNRIDDRHRCQNGHCPSFGICDRIALRLARFEGKRPRAGRARGRAAEKP
jgi:hypothetical protein